jgi:hypothetical protein
MPGEVDFPNVGGCIATLGGDEQCGRSVQLELQCLLNACGPACQVPLSVDDTVRRPAIFALNECFVEAQIGVCRDYSRAAANCGPYDGGVVSGAQCFKLAIDVDTLFDTIRSTCGDRTVNADAGSDGH